MSADEISVQELLQRIDAQVSKMGQQNPNRVLLQQCGAAILSLAQRLPEPQEVVTPAGIILP